MTRTASHRAADRRLIVLTVTALFAFAANSLLCRIALRQASIDAATFSTVRVVSGALMLLAIAARRGRLLPMSGSWTAAGLLALYALPFAFAYAQLSAGTGALILFGCVQVTMFAAALRARERPRALQWLGAVLALAGLVILVFPGLAAPPPMAALLMAVAGVSWGLYSLRGRGTSSPVPDTTGNFVRATPFVVLVSLLAMPRAHADATGLVLSVTSGAITSGLGYVAWYAALRGLTAMHAAVVQLAVPLLAAAGGVLLLSEALSVRLVLSAVLVVGGIAVAIRAGRQGVRRSDPKVTQQPWV